MELGDIKLTCPYRLQNRTGLTLGQYYVSTMAVMLRTLDSSGASNTHSMSRLPPSDTTMYFEVEKKYIRPKTQKVRLFIILGREISSKRFKLWTARGKKELESILCTRSKEFPLQQTRLGRVEIAAKRLERSPISASTSPATLLVRLISTRHS